MISPEPVTRRRGELLRQSGIAQQCKSRARVHRAGRPHLNEAKYTRGALVGVRPGAPNSSPRQKLAQSVAALT
jgi:hypothetical protein